MATFAVNIETITVNPHPNADRLELAQVGLYNIVVGKGSYQTGDKVFYIPEASVLPENLIVTLGLEGKLAGSKHNRVKPVMLRGALSQGLVAPLSVVPEKAIVELGEDADFADVLGITKYEQPIPTSLSGDVTADDNIVSWIEIENLQRFPDTFVDGEPVVMTEKIHGTCSCYTFTDPVNGSGLIVTSKGLGSRRLALKEADTNLYWRMAKKYDLSAVAKNVADLFGGNVEKVAVFGETFGAVQDLKYGLTNGAYGFVMFDIHVTYHDGVALRTVWLNPDVVDRIGMESNVPTPPVLYSGPYDLGVVKSMASGLEQVSGTEAHIREGVVIRPVVRDVNNFGSPRIAKFVSQEYLTRKGGTEYN